MKASPFERGTINSAEANNHIDEIYNLLLQTIPQPAGVNAAWHRSSGISYFGSNMKQSHFIKMIFVCGFFRYYSGDGNSMSPSGETTQQGGSPTYHIFDRNSNEITIRPYIISDRVCPQAAAKRVVTFIV